MEVKERIAAGKNLVGNEFRNLLGDRAVNVARECAVEIQPVHRRCSRARRDSVHVDGRHEDETALNFGRIEFPDKLADRYRALIFIAMIAALEEDRRADAVLDDGDRHTCHTPCIVMRRVRNHDETRLLARLVKIDRRERGSPLGVHWTAILSV